MELEETIRRIEYENVQHEGEEDRERSQGAMILALISK